MQTATSETESKSLDLSICVHHYTLRAPCPKGQGMLTDFLSLLIQGSNEEGRCVNSAADDGMCRALDYMQQQPSSYRNPA